MKSYWWKSLLRREAACKQQYSLPSLCSAMVSTGLFRQPSLVNILMKFVRFVVQSHGPCKLPQIILSVPIRSLHIMFYTPDSENISNDENELQINRIKPSNGACWGCTSRIVPCNFALLRECSHIWGGSGDSYSTPIKFVSSLHFISASVSSGIRYTVYGDIRYNNAQY